MKVKLLTNDIQIRHQRDNAIIALAQCYQSKDMTFKKLVNIAMVRKHKTILECFDLMFAIEDISYLAHVHLIRHRMTTPFVQSQRYTKPNSCIDADGMLMQFVVDDRYEAPQGTLINMCIKMNLREFMHIVELRTAPDALQETQDVVNAMLAEVKKDDVLGRFFE